MNNRSGLIRAAFENAEPEDGLVTIRASDVEIEEVRWLWQDRIPAGKVSVLAGEGGLGKSMLLCAIAATVSRGGRWPNDEGIAVPGSVIILSAEDDIADTVAPRLMAAGADMDKVHLVRAVREDGNLRTFNLKNDLQKMEALIDQAGDTALLIIDPVTSYLGGTDSHKNAEVRSVLEPLGEMASRKRVAIMCNNHLTKAGGVSANSRVMGSVAFTAQARAVTIVSKSEDDDGLRLFLPSKMNVALLPDGLSYRIKTVPLSLMEDREILAPKIEWGGVVEISADEAVQSWQGDEEERGAKAEAMEFLRVELKNGPIEAAEIFKLGARSGHAKKTLKRAKKDLGIESDKPGGFWIWVLPEAPIPSDEIKGANPVKGANPAGPWPPCGTPSVSAQNRGKSSTETIKGANSLCVAPLAPLNDTGQKSPSEKDGNNGWSTEL